MTLHESQASSYRSPKSQMHINSTDADMNCGNFQRGKARVPHDGLVKHKESYWIPQEACEEIPKPSNVELVAESFHPLSSLILVRSIQASKTLSFVCKHGNEGLYQNSPINCGIGFGKHVRTAIRKNYLDQAKHL